MANYRVSGADLTSVADAIRTKGGTSASLSFPDGFVSAVQNIHTGGSPTLITKSIATNGTYDAEDDNADGYSSVTVAVPSTSGGNVVVGTFTGAASEKGSAKTITVAYSGNGYPLSIFIYPTAGAYNSNTDYYQLIQNKAVNTFIGIKCEANSTPDYTNNAIQNKCYCSITYKSGSTNYDSYTSSTVNKSTSTLYRYTAVGDSPNNVARFYNSGTNLVVYIAPDDGSEYGFVAGTEYTYEIVYSS